MPEAKKSFAEKLKHAFAVESDANFSPEELALLEKVALKVAQRQMSTPAIMFLESVRPLNFIGSQAMTFFQPMLEFLINTTELEMLARIFEKRKSIDILIGLIEGKETEVKQNSPTDKKSSSPADEKSSSPADGKSSSPADGKSSSPADGKSNR